MARVFHITGPSGSGKSTLGRELARRGYAVVEADFAPRLAGWIDQETGARVKHEPPFGGDWLARHAWVWDRVRLEELIAETGADVVFVTGGAHNAHELTDLFSGILLVHVADEGTLSARLQAREPERWVAGSPELEQMLAWNRVVLDHHPDACVLDGTRPVDELAEEVERILGF